MPESTSQQTQTPIDTENLKMPAAYRVTFEPHYRNILSDMVREAGGNILPTIDTDNHLNFTGVGPELAEKISQAHGVLEFHKI